MRSKKVMGILLGGAVLMLLIVSTSILLMPFSGKQALLGAEKYIYYTGLMFWISLVLAYIFIGALLITGKKEMSAKGKTMKKGLPGILRFFSNSLAKKTDILFIISVIAFLLCIFTKQITSYITCILMSIMIFLFHMHGIINSKVFYVLEEDKKKNEEV